MNYIELIQRSINYIEENIDGDISLSEISKEAAFSEYHFHRMFQAVVGESVMGYVRKRRLSRSTIYLSNSDERIIDIAIRYGFNSQETYIRAFKKLFGITPGEYRKNKPYKEPFVKFDISKFNFDKNKNNGVIDMEPKIIVKDTFKVIGKELRINAENGENFIDIPKNWEQALSENLISKIPNKVKDNLYLGVCTTYDNAPNGYFAYLICSEVKFDNDIPEGFVAKTIPKAKYAVFTVKGRLPEAAQNMWKYIYSEWLPTCGYERAETEDFELYDERFTYGEDSEMDIYLPIK